VWPRNRCCAMARGALGRRPSAPQRGALRHNRVLVALIPQAWDSGPQPFPRGFCFTKMRCLVGRAVLCPPDIFRRLVAAPVRARKTGFKPKDRVRTSNSGAQWTARPTLTLRVNISAVKGQRIFV
jgi:hypothetical protein